MPLDDISDHIQYMLERDRGITITGLKETDQPQIVDLPGMVRVAMVGARSAVALLDAGGLEDKTPLLIVDDRHMVATMQMLADLRQELKESPPLLISNIDRSHIDIPTVIVKKPGDKTHRKSKKKGKRGILNTSRKYF